MLMTSLEAHVQADKSAILEKEFVEGTKQLDLGIAQTFLIHSTSDPMLWRILTIWSSGEALAAMRASGNTPRGVLMFRGAGAEPTLTVFEIAAHAQVS